MFAGGPEIMFGPVAIMLLARYGSFKVHSYLSGWVGGENITNKAKLGLDWG